MPDIGRLTGIKPALGRVVVELLESEYTSSSGKIILPFGGEKITTCGRVVSTCDPYKSASDDQDKAAAGPLYSVGDVVIFGKYVGSEVQIERKKYIVMNESDILGTLYAGENA